MKIFDLHCDTLMECYLNHKPLRDGAMQLNLEKMADGDVACQCFAIYIPTHTIAQAFHVTQTPMDYYNACLQVYRAQLAENQDWMKPVTGAAEIEEAWREGTRCAVLTVEDGVLLEGDLTRLDGLYADGVRMLSLTHDFENCIGFPHVECQADNERGLKDFGIEVVKRMNELGIIVDVSHLSDGGFRDVVRHSQKPFVASHSCARALGSTSRNLSDELLRQLGDSGGVCGINFYPGFLKDGSDYALVDHLIGHMQHIKQVAGIEAVAFGSDYDGNNGRKEWGDCDGLQQIVDAMSAVFTQDEIEKICWKNAMRLFRDVVGERT